MRTVALALTLSLVVITASPALAGTIDLPTPEASRVQQSQLILAVGGRPDRLKHSIVPGKVVNDEAIDVGITGSGGVATVAADQRLDVEGVGDYAIRERGPARSATSLGTEDPPFTQRGAVVWEGFTSGHRDLAARLVLDPSIEAQHLPLQISVTGDLGPGGAIPRAETFAVSISNVTSQPQDLPTGTDAPAAVLAGPLDIALRTAQHPSAKRLPTTDDVLPKELSVTGPAQQPSSQAVPLRLTGALRLLGTTGSVSGPATTPTANGATFAGTLGGSAPGTENASVSFDVTAAGPGTLVLSLDAVDALNPTELAPPRGFPTWAAWAASKPPMAERKAALDLLVDVAASGARASSYSPYLGADLTGSGSTSFHFAFAPKAVVIQAAAVLNPRWIPLSLAGLVALLLAAAGTVVWRRS